MNVSEPGEGDGKGGGRPEVDIEAHGNHSSGNDVPME